MFAAGVDYLSYRKQAATPISRSLKTYVMNYRILIILLVAFFYSPLAALAQSWNWNIGGEGPGNAKGQCIATDRAGNIYVAGNYRTSIRIDTVELSGSNSEDIFVAKLSASHQLLWARSVGGNKEDIANSIDVDNAGNVYIAGYFTDTAYFDSTRLISKGQRDMFVSKLSPEGTVLWIATGGGLYDEDAYGVHIDQTQNVYVVGRFASYNGSPPVRATAQFDTTVLRSLADDGGFIAKYDTGGKLKWIKSIDCYSGIWLSDVKTDGYGNAYISGYFSGEKIFFNGNQLTSPNRGFIIGTGFTAKYDSSGNYLWSQAIGGYAYNSGSLASSIAGNNSIGVDVDGNSYVVGAYDRCDLKIGSITIPSDQGYDIYMVKYDPSGTILWARAIRGIEQEMANAVALDKNGYPYMTGYFGNGAVFGNDTFHTGRGGDLFISKWSKSGSMLWTKPAGGGGGQIPNDICVDTANQVYITGHFAGNALFGGFPLFNTGGQDMFIASIAQPHLSVPNRPANGAVSIYPNPSSGIFNVDFKGYRYHALYVVNLFGVIVCKADVKGKGKTSINISNLSNGVYYLNLYGQDAATSARIVLAQ
jgi:hypothetical protein